MKTFAAFLALLLLSVLPAAAAKRIALVIGNSDYGHVIDLQNPVNDADLMEKTLKDVGFEVIRHNDLDQRGMKQAMLEFGRKLKEGAEASMFYYAGHGIELKGRNYLVPVDADTQSEDEADIQNVAVDSFLSLTENSKVPLNIVILDACRNNPFRSLRATASGGLAPVKAPSGTYVAYATSPGAVANDGDGANSPFTLALAESMRQPGLTLEAVLKRTRSKVQEATNNTQLPYDSSAITGEFYFIPAVATETPAVQPQAETPETPVVDAAQAAFLAAGDDPAMLKVVVDTFGSSVWGALAREKLKKFAPTEPPVAEEEAPPAASKSQTSEEVVAPDAPPADATPADEPVVTEEPDATPPVKTPVVKKAPKKIAEPPAVRRLEPKKPIAKVYQKPRVAKPVRPKAATVVIRKPKPIVVKPKAVQAARLPRCDGANLSKGSLCSRGSAVCRVAAVGRGGSGRPIIMGCH